MLTIARCFIDFRDFNSQPAWRTGDHVLMPNVRTWRKNVGSPTFVSRVECSFVRPFPWFGDNFCT